MKRTVKGERVVACCSDMVGEGEDEGEFGSWSLGSRRTRIRAFQNLIPEKNLGGLTRIATIDSDSTHDGNTFDDLHLRQERGAERRIVWSSSSSCPSMPRHHHQPAAPTIRHVS
nr:hypothetical protein CFP56_30872 [Quercus suber]